MVVLFQKVREELGTAAATVAVAKTLPSGLHQFAFEEFYRIIVYWAVSQADEIVMTGDPAVVTRSEFGKP